VVCAAVATGVQSATSGRARARVVQVEHRDTLIDNSRITRLLVIKETRVVTTYSENSKYRTRFTVDGHTAYADASKEKGGAGAGFGPHALLEASVACCINIWLRMYADKNGIALSGVTVELRLNRQTGKKTMIEYAVDLEGDLSENQRHHLHQQIATCPVSQTLLKGFSFQEVEWESIGE
jgi:putative redox protein